MYEGTIFGTYDRFEGCLASVRYIENVVKKNVHSKIIVWHDMNDLTSEKQVPAFVLV